MADRYIEAGGDVEVIISIFSTLERLYPFQTIPEARIWLRSRRSRLMKPPRVHQDRVSPILSLFVSMRQWQRYCPSVKSTWLFLQLAEAYGLENMARIPVDFQIALTVAHEWRHLMQIDTTKAVVLSIYSYRQTELDAEGWAWKFVAYHWQEFLSPERVPLAIRKLEGSATN